MSVDLNGWKINAQGLWVVLILSSLGLFTFTCERCARIIHHVVVCLNTDAERQRQEKLVLFFETKNLILRFKTLFSQSTIILVDGFGTALLHFHPHLEIWIPILPLKICLLGLTVSACNFVYCAVPIFLKFSNCVLIIVQYTSCLFLCSSEFEFRTSLFFPPFVCFLNNKKFS